MDQGLADRSGGITRRHHFYKAVRMKLALRITKDLVAKLASREGLLLLEQPIMAALLSGPIIVAIIAPYSLRW